MNDKMRTRILNEEYYRVLLSDSVLWCTIIASQCWRIQLSVLKKKKTPWRDELLFFNARVLNEGRTSRSSELRSCCYCSVINTCSKRVEITEAMWTRSETRNPAGPAKTVQP